jgi:hypothetical protein
MRPEDLGIGRLFEKALDAVIVAVAETQRFGERVAEDIRGRKIPERTTRWVSASRH